MPIKAMPVRETQPPFYTTYARQYQRNLPISADFSDRAKKSGLPCGRPDYQTYLRVPSIPSVAWQPYPSPLGRLRAHSFASPPHDGFAFVEDGLLTVLQMDVTPKTCILAATL